MVELNLYPWRIEKKRYESKTLNKLAITSILLTLLQCMLLHTFLQVQVDQMRDELTRINEEIQQNQLIQAKMTKQHLPTTQLDLQKLLLTYQQQTLRLLLGNAGMQSLPVCINQLSREKDKVIVRGKSISTTALSSFLRQWQSGNSFTSMKVVNLHQVKNEPFLTFTLVANEYAYPF